MEGEGSARFIEHLSFIVWIYMQKYHSWIERLEEGGGDLLLYTIQYTSIHILYSSIQYIPTAAMEKSEYSSSDNTKQQNSMEKNVFIMKTNLRGDVRW